MSDQIATQEPNMDNVLVNTGDCPWIIDSRVPIQILHDWQNPFRDCADWWVENLIGNKVAEFLGAKMTHQTVGNFPEYDIILNNNVFVEIKISTFNNDNRLFIETAKESYSPRGKVARKTPSGLSKSKSDYYILLNPGRTKVGPGYQVVMKMRFIKTEILHELARTTAETSISAPGSKLSYGFEIDLRDPDFEDGCLGHFQYDEKNKVVDFSRFTGYRKEISKVATEFNRDHLIKRI